MHNDQTDQSLNDQRLKFAKRPVELVNRFEDQVDDDSSQLQPFINGDDSDGYCDSEAEETSSSRHHGDGGQPRSKVLYEHYKYYKCSNVVFKSAFRMTKATFHMICGELASAMAKQDTTLQLIIPVRQKITICLYCLATGHPLQTVSNFFRLDIDTCHKVVLETCDAIQTVLMPKFLQWPDKDRLEQIITEFRSISPIPNICGIIDTTHISMIATETTQVEYIDENQPERDQAPSDSTMVHVMIKNNTRELNFRISNNVEELDDLTMILFSDQNDYKRTEKEITEYEIENPNSLTTINSAYKA
ncbi:hypothetical protein E3N88_44494 [Mikania micrantha]|uniref:DDE Tnp4 domain-containing protein n=1 Tax=Mikania micrantha TaxID=192012 RepID=A0A5N6LCH3_9ASTR|nr:hypothetical protein E3N88_44494 [Mikania micrantha]